MLTGLEQKTIIVTGHYGSGKTNLSINLALELKQRGDQVLLADLDIVNPYFRSADFRDLAKKHGILLAASSYANSNVEFPSLGEGLTGYIGGDITLVIDVGGDDAGAAALGGLAQRIRQTDYRMLYVVNRYRYLTQEPHAAIDMLHEIERKSRLRVTDMINNSNLGEETTATHIEDAVAFAQHTARECGLQLLFTAARRDLATQIRTDSPVFPIDVLVKKPWE